jgi:hypothetical protein
MASVQTPKLPVADKTRNTTQKSHECSLQPYVYGKVHVVFKRKSIPLGIDRDGNILATHVHRLRTRNQVRISQQTKPRP